MEKNELIIENIELNPNTLPKELTIAFFQLKSPFFDELIEDINPFDYTIILSQNNSEIYQKRIEKIKRIFTELEKINKRRKEKINLIVFPEYSFPPELLEECRNFVNNNHIIVIGNYYNKTEHASTSFVLIPNSWANDTLYKANKYSISTPEKGFLDQQKEIRMLKILWKPDENTETGYIQVFTCKDFLCFNGISHVRKYQNCIDTNKPGIIIVPMCSPEIKPFIDDAERLLREAKSPDGCNRANITTILCNCTDVSGMVEPFRIKGGRRVISLVNEKLEEKNIVLEECYEGFLLVKLNPFGTIFRPTPKCFEPNAVLLKLSKIRIDHNLDFIHETKEHTGVIINPFIFKELGLKKVWAFMVIKDYGKFKKRVKTIPKKFLEQSIGIHGIWGYHDLLIQSYEHSDSDELRKQNIQIRLWPLLEEENFNEKFSLGIAYVKRPLKVHGEIINGEMNSYVQQYIRDHCPLEHHKELKIFLHNVATGRDWSFDIVDKYKKNGIFLPAEYDLSDRSDEERENGLFEFLVLLQIEKRNDRQLETKEQLFENNALDEFISDDRIRTIEVLESSGEALVNANYLFHIVGDMDVLKEIVLDKMISNNYPDIICKTQVIIPHEKILENNFPVLFEPENHGTSEEKLNKLILDYLNIITRRSDLYVDVFTIKRIDSTTSDILFRTYDVFRDLNDCYYKNEFHQANEEALEYIFSLSNIFEKYKSNILKADDIIDFHSRASPFLGKLGKRIEKCIFEISERILNELMISVEEYNEVINKAAMAKNSKFQSGFDRQEIEIGTAILPLNLLNKLMKDPKGFSRFSEKYPGYTDQEINRKYEYAKKINEYFDEYLKPLEKHDADKSINYINSFGKLRNFAAHDIIKTDRTNFKNFKQEDIPEIPKIVFEVCKQSLTIHGKLNKK